MAQIIDYDPDDTLESADVFLIDGTEGTRTVSLSVLQSTLDAYFKISESRQVLDNEDLDDIPDGLHYALSTCSNKPTTVEGELYQATHGDHVFQRFITWDSYIYTRQCVSGTWGSWTMGITEQTKTFSLSGTTLTITDGAS